MERQNLNCRTRRLKHKTLCLLNVDIHDKVIGGFY
ncbi:MAG: hypothetical protein E6Q83_17400 [Thiothrix sp.]|nr:MAG: hypothetical protein E6Q83_17400 [Thiothrix sp.]